VASHCFNLPTKEAANASRFAGHRCSIIITGVGNKTTPPFWIEATSPDLNKVVFDLPPQVRIPSAYNFTTTFDTATSTCATSTNYHTSQAAGCSRTHAESQATNITGLIFDGATGVNCSPAGESYPTRRITLQVQANGNPSAFSSTPAVLVDSTDDFTTINSQGTCASANLDNSTTCTIKLDMTRPFNETMVTIGGHFVRTGESPRCTGSTKDL
jgi:hypothetical protein